MLKEKMLKNKQRGIKMKNLNSLSLFVGTGECNANCGHCAGIPLRKYAPKEDGIVNEDLIHKTIQKCHEWGARYLSISSSGEPTLSPLSVTKTLELVDKCKEEKIKFSPINIYSNGIRIGEDKGFCNEYLPLWKKLGLTTAYITVHDIDENENAKIYGIKEYPSLELVVSRIHGAGLLMRANLVLSKKTINNLYKFTSTANYLKNIGVDYVSAWPIRNSDDKADPELSPSESELDRIESWVNENHDSEHSSGYRIVLLREKSMASYEKGEKLTLFPDGTLSNTWCN